MIPRRVHEHVKAHNWFAVAIDFVIVVVGVFVGIQVSNWNEARFARAHERALFVNLRDDIRQDIEETRRRIGLLDQAARYGRSVMPQLKGDVPCTDDCWKIVVNAFQASQFFDLRTPRPTFDEMSRLGLPRDKALKDRVNTYYFLSDGVLITNDMPRYRELVRSLIPPEAQTRLWADCYQIDGRKEILTDDCAPALSPEQSRNVVAALRENKDIATTLTYRLSAIDVLIEVLESQIAEGEAVITRIDSEIGPSRS